MELISFVVEVKSHCARRLCQTQAWRDRKLTRVNPRDTATLPSSIVLPVGVLQAIHAVDRMIP
jgi:hypothetical protein